MMPASGGAHFHPRDRTQLHPLLAAFVQGPPQRASDLRLHYLEGAHPARAAQRTLLARALVRAEGDDNDGGGDNFAAAAAGGGPPPLVVRYEARSFGAAAPALAHRGSFRLLLGVLHRKRGRLDVYEPEAAGALFGLHLTHAAAGGAAAAAAAAASAAAAAALESASAHARRDELIGAFGSRKRQALERSKVANIVDVQAVTAAGEVASSLRVLAQGASAVAWGEGAGAGDGHVRRAEVAQDLARREILPPWDASATTPAAAFPISGIILEADREALQPTVAAVARTLRASDADAAAVEAAAAPFAEGSTFVCERLALLAAAAAARGGGLGDGGEQRAVREQLRALFFLSCLLRLHRAGKELRPLAGAALCLDGVPPAVAEHLFATFADRRSGASSRQAAEAVFGLAEDASSGAGASAEAEHFVRTPALIDRLSSYIACVSLASCGHAAFSPLLLAADLKLPLPKLLHFFQQLGCTTSKEKGSGVTLVRLAVPLTFPKAKVSRGR